MAWYADKRVLIIAVITILAAGLILLKGLNVGIEFSGGTRIPITLEKSVTQSTMADIVSTIKVRTTKFGLTQVVVRSVGDRQIYVEVPQSDPQFVAEIERILKAEGKFEAIIDGRVALTGDDIISGSIRENPEMIGENIRWGVSFVISQDAAKKFGDVAYGKGNYPVNLFLDRVEDAAIIVHKADITDEDFTEDETDEAVRSILNFSGNELIVLEGPNATAAILASARTTFIVSENETAIIELLNNSNRTVVKKASGEMKAVFEKGQLDNINVGEWPAIGLLSAPILNENLATGKAGQMYNIEGSAVGATYEERKDYATQEMRRIKSILSGGALPVRLVLGSLTTVPPSLGKEFLNYSTIGIVFAFAAVLAVVVIRYRKPKALGPLVFTPIAEMLILVAVLGSIGTLDLATIAGLFSAMGSAVNAQIVVSDDLLSAKVLTKDEARRKIKRSFYIITRDAAILIIVMLPLLFSNIVEIIGFITAMLLGTLLNIIITTQVYDAFGQSIARE